MSEPVTLRLSEQSWKRIQRLAIQEGRTVDEMVGRLVEDALQQHRGSGKGMLLDDASDLVGSIEWPDGPMDLSTNKEHLHNLGRSDS